MYELELTDDEDKIVKKKSKGKETEAKAEGEKSTVAVPEKKEGKKTGGKKKKKEEKAEEELITLEELDEELPQPTTTTIKEEDLMVVQTILLYRKGRPTPPPTVDHKHSHPRISRDDPTSDDAAPTTDNAAEREEKEEDWYYVKFRNFSYLHCQWHPGSELDIVDKRFAGKAKRYHAKRDNATTWTDEQFDEDEPFNPDYLQVERVLDVSTEIIPKPNWERILRKARKRKAREDKAKRLKEEAAAAEIARKAAKAAALAAEAQAAAEARAAAEAQAATDQDAQSNAQEGQESKPNGEEALEKPEKESEKEPAPETVEKAVEKTEEEDKKCEEKMEEDAAEETKKDDEVMEEPTEPTEKPAEEEEEEEEESEDETDPEDTQGLTHYLCKWRSLQYEDATWEVASDVDGEKIAEFEARREPTQWRKKEKSRPTAAEWRKANKFPVFKNANELREYQQEGLNWLLFCWFNKQNCILADEMGLGKTIQTLTFLHQVQSYGVHGPFLVIAPLSTIHNWARECETWTDINAVVYHGTSQSRGMIAEYEMFYRDEARDERVKGMYKFDLLITTYEMILVDCEALKEIPWRVCVIDEAHRLKNRNCSLLKGLALFRMEHRVLLTGTPLQNNIDELFSLLNFLEPKQFACSIAFLSEFGNCQTDEQVGKIQEILKPMMLRRLKEDVEKSLIPKEETIIEVELTNIQKKYYRAILEKNFSYLSRGASAPSLMNTMMELRKCCNHPFLINGAEEQIMEEYRAAQGMAFDDDAVFHTTLIQSSGKLVLCDKLLPRLRKEGHKVLVFSQMVKVLNLIEDYLVDKRYPYERIDGNVRGDLRQAAIDRFSKPDSDRFVFLLCTRAGGLGINLTAADTVIIYDSDWNPQNDLQAQARCHRIGQEKMVKVLPSHHSQHLRARDVRQGLPQARARQGRSPVHRIQGRRGSRAALQEGSGGAAAQGRLRRRHGRGQRRRQVLRGRHRPDPPATHPDHHHPGRSQGIHFCQGLLQRLR